jgi:hypothetical protein
MWFRVSPADIFVANRPREFHRRGAATMPTARDLVYSVEGEKFMETRVSVIAVSRRARAPVTRRTRLALLLLTYGGSHVHVDSPEGVMDEYR